MPLVKTTLLFKGGLRTSPPDKVPTANPQLCAACHTGASPVMQLMYKPSHEPFAASAEDCIIIANLWQSSEHLRSPRRS